MTGFVSNILTDISTPYQKHIKVYPVNLFTGFQFNILLKLRHVAKC